MVKKQIRDAVIKELEDRIAHATVSPMLRKAMVEIKKAIEKEDGESLSAPGGD